MIRKKIRDPKLRKTFNIVGWSAHESAPKEKRHCLAPRPSQVTEIYFRFSIFNFWAISLWFSQLVLNFADWAFFSVDLKILKQSIFCHFEIWSLSIFRTLASWELSLFRYPFATLRLTQEIWIFMTFWILDLFLLNMPYDFENFHTQHISLFRHFFGHQKFKIP